LEQAKVIIRWRRLREWKGREGTGMEGNGMEWNENRIE
jgi:hypothetical protein